jgi:hypothetical protein
MQLTVVPQIDVYNPRLIGIFGVSRMPCSNIIEQIKITLDHQERLADYQFIKQTCGQGVGAKSLLADYLIGLTIDELLAINDQHLLEVCRPADEISTFLHLKHLFAIQAVLEIYTGRSGAKDSPCTIAEVGASEGQVVIDADVDIGLVTDRIKACDGCHGCGTASEPMDV